MMYCKLYYLFCNQNNSSSPWSYLDEISQPRKTTVRITLYVFELLWLWRENGIYSILRYILALAIHKLILETLNYQSVVRSTVLIMRSKVFTVCDHWKPENKGLCPTVSIEIYSNIFCVCVFCVTGNFKICRSPIQGPTKSLETLLHIWS
jgi:hypothetical protein